MIGGERLRKLIKRDLGVTSPHLTNTSISPSKSRKREEEEECSKSPIKGRCLITIKR